jgi:polysaccharide export outer membrane protein
MKLRIAKSILFAFAVLFFSMGIAYASDYEIQVYDEITFEYTDASGHTEIYQKLRVLPNGKITAPIAGEISAAGLTATNLKEELNRKLQSSKYSVDLQVFHERGKVVVMGAVRNPGGYPLSDMTSIYDAIGLAGGFSITSNKRHVKVIRQNKDGTRSSFYVNFPKEVFRAYEQGSGIGEEKYILKEDDIVWVPHSKIKLVMKGLWYITQIASIGFISGGIAAAIN